MKTIKLMAMAALFAIGFAACEKSGVEQNTLGNQISERAEITIVISWDEWGRKSKDCNGAGLCNFKIEVEKVEDVFGKIAYVKKDLNGNYYIDVAIDKDFEFQDSDKLFYIDEDIINVDTNGVKYILPKGNYKFNSSIGQLGGYRIPVKISF